MVSSTITIREMAGVSIVVLKGRIVFGEESNFLRSKVKSLIAEGKQKIILDMKEVEYIDSAGLGILVAAHFGAKTHGAALRLCSLGPKFQEVLRLTRLTGVFQISATEASAIASLHYTVAGQPQLAPAADQA